MKSKKKWLIISVIGFIILILFFYRFLAVKQTKKNITLTFDESTHFSTKDLDEGADAVISSFHTGWRGSTLHSIRFDNTLYEQEMTGKNEGSSSFSPISDENTLILIASFTTGKRTGGSIGPNSYIDYWQFVLIRSTKYGPWRVVDQGV